MNRCALGRFLVAALVFTILTGRIGLAGGVQVTDSPATDTATYDTEYIILQFTDAPAASYTGTIPGLAKTKPTRGKYKKDSAEALAYASYLDSVHVNYRAHLAGNAPKAQVAREYRVAFNGMVVKRNGEKVEKVVNGNGVKSWTYASLYYPSMNVSAPLIGADTLWGANRADAGAGLAVAIIDSGIEDGHPFFTCKGQNGVPAIVHHGPYYSGNALGVNNPLPIIYDNHGTHVAGTVGGCVVDLAAADPDGPVTGAISGLAPAVALHDFNVFPGRGAGLVNHWGGAFSHDIAAAIEDAVLEPVDVINMSLGGGVQGPNDFLALVSDAAVDAGVVVVAAAGNTGPGDRTVESPGSGRKVIAAGAISNPHYIGIPVTVDGTTYGAVLGEFAAFTDVTANYTVVDPADGCTALSADLTGQLALIDRGACTFSTKVLNAEAAGALGVLIANNRAGDPIPMALDTTLPTPTIPAAMLSQADGNAIQPSGAASIGSVAEEFLSSNADILADFSSWGPTPFTYLIKPDVMAPGVNVYSSVFSLDDQFNVAGYDFEMFQGTSMATPHVAGSAVLLLEQHPNWSPLDVRSALVNNAARTVTDTFTASEDPGVNTRGGGRVDLVAADATPLMLNPATASFGLKQGNAYARGKINITVRNVSGASQSCTVALTGPDIVSVAPTAFTLEAGQSTVVALTLDAGTSGTTGSGDYEGDAVITAGSTELKVPWFVRVDRNGKP